MNSIGLNKDLLSRISHHWFWGLRKTPSAGAETLYDMVMDLQNNPEKKEHIEQLLKRVASYWSITQAIFWLFNIQGYRTSYYQFQSHASWQFYENRASMMSNEEKQQVEQTGGFVLNLLSKIQENHIRSNAVWFYNGIQPYIPFLPEITQQNNPATGENDKTELEVLPPEHFIITESMITALHKLGLDNPVGDKLSFVDLKAAYRESLLRTHPDKTGQDSQATFIAVREAMQFIMDNANQSTAKQTASSNNDFLSEFKKAMAKMDEAIERERLVSRTIGEKAKLYCAKADDYCAGVSELGAGVSELSAGVSELSAAVKEHAAQVKKGFDRIDKAQALLAEMWEMMGSLEAQLVPLEEKPAARKESKDVFFEMAAAYEAVAAYKPVHGLKRNSHLLFQAVLTDISRLEHRDSDSLPPNFKPRKALEAVDDVTHTGEQILL